MGFEVIGVLKLFAQDTVVVYFAIYSQGEGSVIVDQRLSASVYILSGRVEGKSNDLRTNANDTQSLVGQD